MNMPFQRPNVEPADISQCWPALNALIQVSTRADSCSREFVVPPNSRGRSAEATRPNCARPIPHDYSRYFEDALARLKGEGRYRVFADLERVAGRFPEALWHGPAGGWGGEAWGSSRSLGIGPQPGANPATDGTPPRPGDRPRGHPNIPRTH